MKRIRVPLGRPRLLFDELLLFLEKELTIGKVGVMIEITSEGPAAAYALVWEWGNVRQTKEGPKTTLGINPNGERVWLTIQAPRGYIRVLTPQFHRIVKDELSHMKVLGSTKKKLTTVANKIGRRMLKLLKDTVPVDTGDLHDSLKVSVDASNVEV